uniref:Uncharacterized protein n=1 Tax=Trichogramma kaykai TaxID=54128 RepID=A0ABD2XN16_9HYME
MFLWRKEEPSEVSFDECGDGIMNEPIDHKNVQLLPFRDNLILRIPRCDDIMIEFECQNVKSDKDLLLRWKMNSNKIKKEPAKKLKEENINEMAEESNSNFDGEVHNEMEIEFECHDEKLDKNILLGKKMNLTKIKKESQKKIKEEVVNNTAEESNSNFDGEVNNEIEIEFECINAVCVERDSLRRVNEKLTSMWRTMKDSIEAEVTI